MVKNFEDKESDDIISRNSWKNIYNDDPYYGRMMFAGLEESKGDVITVLDDDDLYTGNRLEKVYKAFTSYECLTYFHNSQTIIDNNGNALKRPPLSKNLVGESPVLIDVNKLDIFAKKHGMSVIDAILKIRAGADINSSSLAVRRSALEVNAHLLRELPAGFDVFALVSSVKAGGLMYFTDEKLTLYRVHGENWSRPAKGEGKGAYLKLARTLLVAINAYRLISSRLLNDDINEYLCFERLHKGELQLLPLPELGTLPPELRLSLSDVKLTLRCYKVKEVYGSSYSGSLCNGKGSFRPSPRIT